LNNIGDIYRLWANLEQALGYYNKALAVADEYNLADVQATVYNNLGMLYKAKEDFPKALELFNKALGINKKLSDKALVSVNLSNIGETYRQLLDYDKAADYFLQALAIDKEIGIRSRIAKRLNGVALLFSDNGDYATSNTYLLETLKYADASGKVDLATYYGNLGFNYCQLKQFDRAVEYLNKAVEMKEDLRKTAQGTIRMDYLASQIFTYQNLIFTYASAGKPEKALEAMELSRAKYLAERISNTGGLSAAYPGLAAVRKYLDDDTVVIGFSNVGRYFIPMRTVITTKKLEVKELNPEALRISAAAMDEIRAANMKTRGFNIAAGGAAEERKDAGVDTSGYFYDTLSNVVYNFRSLLQKPGMDFLGSSRANEMAKALYGFLLGDLGTLLAEKKKIIIIPDNVLGLLPFETLIDGDNRFVVETHDVEYEHSLTVMQLVHERRYDGARRQLIAFGGAVYDGQSAAAPQSPRPQADASVSETELEAAAAQAGRGNGAADMYSLLHNAVWQNLPGTLAEVTSIGKMFPSATVITGDKVSEENVKALSKRGELGRYKIIHFATHGLTVPDYPELSSLVLSYPGANKNGGDGYLQAPEIAGLSIKADFVNLSACETGLGKIYGGEGIVGLSQSFIIAGANGVSVSLWSVADEPTMEFMTDFYALIKDGNTNFAAGESAVKRTFIKTKNYRHPYYWAPFVYYGK
jgi:CHAT domain-containing protein/Tfp pilus assembly protein PilF